MDSTGVSDGRRAGMTWAQVAQTGIPFMWFGLVVGLSFIEAPLKFRAPGITLELGVGIGRLMFGMLNRIEIGLALAAIIAYLWGGAGRAARSLFAVAVIILIAQTLWLLPVLDDRAERVIAGAAAPFSYHHLLFIILEAIKAVMLLALGMVTARRGSSDAG